MVRRVFDAFAAHDLDAFRDLLDADVVLHVGGGPTTIAGIDAVVAAVTVTVQAIPDLRVTALSAIADGSLAAAEVVREGTHTGAAVLPDGTPSPPSGRAVRLPECLMFTVRGGKVVPAGAVRGHARYASATGCAGRRRAGLALTRRSSGPATRAADLGR